MRRTAFMALYLGLASLIVFLDQWSKFWVVHRLSLGQALKVNGFFSIWLLHNPGAAFGFLSQAHGFQVVFFITVALLAVIIMLYYLYCLSTRIQVKALFLTLILGGALGNMIDRIRLGYVVDFLYFHYKQWYWPNFNLADAAICIGVAYFVYTAFCSTKR